MAHIYALAGMAGVNYSTTRYDYGIDGHFNPVVKYGNRMVQTGFALDFQAKATVDWSLKVDKIVYDLEAKNYNDMVLRTPAESSLVLILLCLPKNREGWHGATHNETILRHCCYWFLVEGEPTPNDSTQRIYIPRENLLTLCANMCETSRPWTITVGRGKKSHFDEHKQDKHFFRCVGSFGA